MLSPRNYELIKTRTKIILTSKNESICKSDKNVVNFFLISEALLLR